MSEHQLLPSLPNSLATGIGRSFQFAFFGVWILFWTLGTLLFDIFLALSFGRDCWTYTYLPTTGIVIHSSVTTRMADEGQTFHPKIEYTYQVDGQAHESDRIRASGSGTSIQAKVDRIVASYPAGANVTVYYDRSSHDKAVLWRGPDEIHFFMSLFMLPFNVIMVGSWMSARAALRSATSDKPPSGVRIDGSDLQHLIRIYPLTPFAAAGIGVGVAGFVMMFLVGFGMFVLPTLPLALVGWLVVLILGSMAYRKAAQHWVQLEIDQFRGQAELQRNGQSIQTFAIADFENVAVEEEFKGENHSFKPVLVLRHEQGERERISFPSRNSRSSPEWIVRWLRAHLQKSPSADDA